MRRAVDLVNNQSIAGEKTFTDKIISTKGADAIELYNGATIVGQIEASDTSWLRINQDVNKNIYTPRYIRADAGLFVDDTNHGIDGSGILLTASFSGTYSSSVSLTNTANTFSGSSYSTTNWSMSQNASGDLVFSYA